jgi:hypothetical protein
MTDDETIVLRSSGLTRDVRFAAHNGLRSDIAQCPKGACQKRKYGPIVYLVSAGD